MLPLMAMVQLTKNKVWPVMDYRELNECIMCHSGGDAINLYRMTGLLRLSI